MSPPGRLPKFYLVCHEQTLWTGPGCWRERLDSPLTEQGAQQAGMHAAALRSVPFAANHSIPTGPALRTAEIIAEAQHLPVRVILDLAQPDSGDWFGLIRAKALTRFPEALEERSRDKYDFRFPGGERWADVDARAAQALSRTEESPSEPVLIVSHEMTGRTLLRPLLNLTPDAALRLSHPQDVIYRIGDARAEHSCAGGLVGAGWLPTP